MILDICFVYVDKGTFFLLIQKYFFNNYSYDFDMFKNLFNYLFKLKIDNQTDIKLAAGKVIGYRILMVVYIRYPIIRTGVFDIK